MIYSKTLDIKDYDKMLEPVHVDNVVGVLADTTYRFEHTHRRWEYGIVLRALRANKTTTVLDVGGGGSVFAPAASFLNMEVLQVDPEPYGTWALAQARTLGFPLPYIQKDFFEFDTRRRFDAVVSISTIEHVENDLAFFDKLLTFVRPGGLLALTVDFHPSREALVYPEHLRTYNGDDLGDLYLRAEDFNFFGSERDYTWRGADVNTYTFASLILRRNG
jgi:SAM-dependent methyltransferase